MLRFTLGKLVASLSPVRPPRRQYLEHGVVGETRLAPSRFDRGVAEEPLQESLGDATADRIGREAVFRPPIERARRELGCLHGLAPDALQGLVRPRSARPRARERLAVGDGGHTAGVGSAAASLVEVAARLCGEQAPTPKGALGDFERALEREAAL